MVGWVLRWHLVLLKIFLSLSSLPLPPLSSLSLCLSISVRPYLSPSFPLYLYPLLSLSSPLHLSPALLLSPSLPHFLSTSPPLPLPLYYRYRLDCNHDYLERINHLQLESLELRRIYNDMTMVFKIVHKFIDF